MTLDVTWLGHSTVVIDVAGVRLVTDPLLGRHAGVLRRRARPPAATATAGADVVLLSHLHHDHAEVASLRALHPAPVVVDRLNAPWLRKKGLDPRGLDVGQWYDVGPGVQVCLVPAVHGDRPMPHRPNAANGHLVRLSTPAESSVRTIWAAGDTELCPELDRVADLAGGAVDVALVPVSGWGPRLSGGHMGPVDAARACAQVGARVAVPVHWGTLHAPFVGQFPRGWMDLPGVAFGVALAEHAPGCEPVVLTPGQTWRHGG
ncbi:L-ascorbate metabolism protein UlaG, beta-lactamase superfamily [Paraoerskovia marina]|uniref:L-ascorbate metabolism protein UlaG, beta-lactamase superfamily n=1 Tax=Paraoerskovia marina TaxID=545619 RepID=A0A1H1TV71_9CELL|nr:MBL fold metallo-hydrolase [Paraoerskovia marina]SDS64215.1 L-ascorbate metabolism protein UlaG, beta-lactamase superfamily [Paraoerskovia marina]